MVQRAATRLVDRGDAKPVLEYRRSETKHHLEATNYLERHLTKPWDVFVEYAGDYTQRGGSRQLAHFGTAYKIASTSQLDFHVGFGLSHATPNHFIAAGYSFRLDGLWSRHR